MNNKKIGILTLSASDNCGSLLQTYALQQVLKKMGHENVEVIDFSSENSKKLYNIFPSDILVQPRRFIYSVIHYYSLRKQKNDYNFFRKSNLCLSSKVYNNEKDIQGLAEDYDIVICGSDQIWNVCMYDFDKSFFLPDVKGVKKIAYAASLGGKSIKTFKDVVGIKRWINDFSHISVRETQGKEEILSVYEKDVEVLADPTLLLTQGEWKDKVGNERLVDKRYIFYYSWSYGDKELKKIVQQVSKESGMPVYVINASKWMMNSYKKYGFKLCKKGGPYAFLNLMYYADLVFVESLHGTIFSSIFNKKFWYLNGIKDGKIDQRNDYFLRLLNMRDRVISKETEFNMQRIMQDVKSDVVNKKLKELIAKSYEWLNNAIEM